MRSTHLVFALSALLTPIWVAACGDDDGGGPATEDGGLESGGRTGSGGRGASGSGSGGRVTATGGRSSGGSGSGGRASGGTSNGGSPTDGGPDADATTDGPMAEAGPSQCDMLATGCHNVADHTDMEGDGGHEAGADAGLTIAECHAAGHGGDEQECSGLFDGCKTMCGEALCDLIATECHEVHGVEGDAGGPLTDCHALGHAGDPDVCFENADCVTMCRDAAADGGHPQEGGMTTQDGSMEGGSSEGGSAEAGTDSGT